MVQGLATIHRFISAQIISQLYVGVESYQEIPYNVKGLEIAILKFREEDRKGSEHTMWDQQTEEEVKAVD